MGFVYFIILSFKFFDIDSILSEDKIPEVYLYKYHILKAKGQKYNFKLSLLFPSYNYDWRLIYYPGFPYPINYEEKTKMGKGSFSFEIDIPFIGKIWFSSQNTRRISEYNIYETEKRYYLYNYFTFEKNFLDFKNSNEVKKLNLDLKINDLERLIVYKKNLKEAKELYVDILYLRKIYEIEKRVFEFYKIIDSFKLSKSFENYFRIKSKICNFEYSLREMEVSLSGKKVEFSNILGIDTSFVFEDDLDELYSFFKDVEIDTNGFYLSYIFDSLSFERDYLSFDLEDVKLAGKLGFMWGTLGWTPEELKQNQGFKNFFYSLEFSMPLTKFWKKDEYLKKYKEMYLKRIKLQKKLDFIQKYRKFLLLKKKMENLEKLKKEADLLFSFYIEEFKKGKMGFSSFLEKIGEIYDFYKDYYSNVKQYINLVIELEYFGF